LISPTCQLHQDVYLILPYQLRQLRLWQPTNIAPHATDGSNLQQQQQQSLRSMGRDHTIVTAAAFL
jgi:hypothetical protein